MCRIINPIAFRQYRVPAVDLVSDPPTQLSMRSRGAEPSSESACGFSCAGPTAWNSLPHHLHQISDTVTLVFSSAASKLNYFV